VKKIEVPDNLPPKAVADAICGVIDNVAEALSLKDPLFILVVYDGAVNAHSIGDVPRVEAIAALRETADRIEQLEDVEPDIRALKRLVDAELDRNGRKGGGH
jgi:hypothetical protein